MCIYVIIYTKSRLLLSFLDCSRLQSLAALHSTYLAEPAVETVELVKLHLQPCVNCEDRTCSTEYIGKLSLQNCTQRLGS